MTTRVCANCKVEKPFAEFNKDSRKKHGIRYNCRGCERSRMKDYDASEAGQRRMRVGRWKAQGIEITHDEYVEMYKRLQGRCQICTIELPSLCVDHNHDTGKVRGLLCRPCNIGVSALGENERVLRRAIAYLKDSL